MESPYRKLRRLQRDPRNNIVKDKSLREDELDLWIVTITGGLLGLYILINLFT